MNNEKEAAPFSMPVNVRTLPRKGFPAQYLAPEDVRASIAEQFSLIELAQFRGEALVTPWKKNGVKITGRIRADVTQHCAITADPLETTVDEEIDVIFVPEGSKLARPRVNEEGEIILDPEGDDLPETFSGDTIDLATIWLEFFALGFDPFARKEGAKLPVDDTLEKDESPFAALSQLKKH